MGDVTADLIDEILLRLPVKPLLRFKSVCKRWFSLIGSRSFADLHFRQPIINKNRPLIDPDDIGNLYLSMYAIADTPGIPSKTNKKNLHALGPAKGVFCEVSKEGTIALSNLAMKETKALPQPIPVLSVHKLAFGFGFDHSSGAFKIVVFPFPEITSTTYIVYNSTTNSWKHLTNERVEMGALMPDPKWNHEQSRLLNGVYYWLVRFNRGGDIDYAILAFDMATEEFREVMPVPDRGLRLSMLRLAVYRGSLALMSYEVGGSVHLWAMVGKQWVRSLSVGPFEDMAWPLCVWNNVNRHEMLLETQKGCRHHILCDLSTKAVRTVQLRPPNDLSRVYKVFAYKHSLVSTEEL